MPHINISLIAILAKIAIFVILAYFEHIVRGEELEVAKKTEDMLKRIVLASQKTKTELKKLL